MYKQAIIYFKDGTKDWVDPIDNEYDIKFYDDIIVICNGYHHSYEYSRYEVEKVVVIDIDEVICKIEK